MRFSPTPEKAFGALDRDQTLEPWIPNLHLNYWAVQDPYQFK